MSYKIKHGGEHFTWLASVITMRVWVAVFCKCQRFVMLNDITVLQSLLVNK